MEIWIFITIIAAFLQNIRSVMQKHLKGVMGTTGATFVRFGFGVPFALLHIFILVLGFGATLPVPGAHFFGWAGIGALTQVAGTFLLVHLFSFRNFAVGTAYSRTEPAQAALFGLVFFGERASGGTLLAIALSVLGVMVISVARLRVTLATLVTSVFTRTALVGILSGMAFGISTVSYRSASLSLAPSLPEPNYIVQASYTLVYIIAVQTLSMLAWMLWKERGEFARIAQAWKPSLVVGFMGATASFCWLMAVSLQQASVVKALGQVEMLLAFGSAVFIFRETINRLEIAGCVLIVAGVLILLLA
ncbi:DMT family transporter [Rhizobium sp. CFBP 8762]|uniref:DMT family transporter n=1 Tax=Rhizobium sp. CFBP 8762 TaxID=2775279 RepID=UPI0017856D25|nr:DMT family transporter [Rhizobium sp. CFBP 8762]MBD8553654.1 DMT family transporter [Rhizobium sp. CFBP 8762]